MWLRKDPKQALTAVEALALRVIGDRLEHGEPSRQMTVRSPDK